MEEGTDPLHAKFHPYRCNVSPLRGEKPQIRPLRKVNNGGLRFSKLPGTCVPCIIPLCVPLPEK